MSQHHLPRVRFNPFPLAMVEYSLDLQIPEHVWDHPILQEMSKAAIDIMTWPNVRCEYLPLRPSMPMLITVTLTGSLFFQRMCTARSYQ